MARRKKRIAVIDAETDPFEFGADIQPFCWGFYDGTIYQQFWGDNCTEQLIEFLSTEEDLIVYAHNGGKFDYFFLLKYLDKTISLINGRIAKSSLFDGAIELRDSYLILPLPLSEHDKDEIDYDKFKRECREFHRPEISAYLRKDCVSLFDWVSLFIGRFGNNLTLASTAFAELKKTGYDIQNTNDSYDSRMRPFYYGGRVQCFKTGCFKGDYKYYDINSAYPYAMLSEHWSGPQIKQVLRLPESENGSWFGEIDAISHGALPFRGEDERLYFPNDNQIRRYRVSGWEINAGLETGTLNIKKVHTVLKPVFKQNFVDYINKFYAEKLEAERSGDKTNRTFAKLMQNAAYGKFGQDGRKFEEFTIVDFGEWPDGDDWKPYSETAFGQSIFVRPDPQDRFYNVATAASITGFVRAYLWKAICASDEPLYCDTDSLICKSFAGTVGDQLGEWKLEADIAEAYIAQRKMYALKTKDGERKVASKGVRLNFEQIKRGVETGENITFYKESPAYSLKHGRRYSSRKIDFQNIAKNSLVNPLA